MLDADADADDAAADVVADADAVDGYVVVHPLDRHLH